MVMGYAVMLTVIQAMLLGMVFAAASSLAPMLVTLGLSGVLSRQMARQLCHALPWVQLGVYIVFFLVAAVSLL